jgi:superfamily II DNA or RNA helicase
MIELRPYQLDAVDRVRAAIRAGHRRPMLAAPTGSGKTCVATHIIASALEHGSRVLFVAHRRELIRQPFAKLVRNGIPADSIGIIMAGVPLPSRQPELPLTNTDGDIWAALARRRPTAPIQIASIDTLRNRAKPQADVIVIDEAHRTLAKSYRVLLDEYPAAVTLGMTATPTRTDARGLGEVYDELVVVASYGELVTKGFLVEPRVWTVPAASLPDLSSVRVKGGDYDPEELERACNQGGLIGDLVDHYARHGNDAPTVVFAAGVEHSRTICARFQSAGIAAVHVDGTTPVGERDAALAALADGSVRVICNCDVLTEGVDVPCIKTVVLARPTKSVRVYLQQVGRGSRPHGDLPFVVLDHAGCAVEHGLPQDDREWSLEAKPKRRGASKGAPTRTCQSCFAVLPLSTVVCPECGAELESAERKKLEEHDGHLVEARPLTLDEKRAAWDAIVADWREQNRHRPYPRKPGWCWYEYQRRFHSKPPAGCRAPALTSDELAARSRLEGLQQTATARGYAPAWVHVQMASRDVDFLPPVERVA